MSDSPYTEALKKERDDLIKFRQYLWFKGYKEPCELKIEFHNKRFKSPSGFALLDGPSLSMSRIVQAINKEVDKQIIDLNKRIREDGES